jgi:hypothetical protein
MTSPEFPTLSPKLKTPLYWILTAWLVVSSLYYVEALITGNFRLDYSSGVLHKVFKYLFAGGFSILLAFALGCYRTALTAILLLSIAVGSYFINDGLISSNITFIILGSFLGFTLLIPMFQERLDMLIRVIVLTGVLTAVISMLEVVLLRDILREYWAQTGGIRSVSTLLNPNNLGLYQGACLILWGYSFHKHQAPMYPGPLLASALVASGSRTAVVALLATTLVALIVDRNLLSSIRSDWRRHARALVLLVIASFATLIYTDNAGEAEEIVELHRGTDLHTLKLRGESAQLFFSNVDYKIIAPDIKGERAKLVQDNAYLSVINSLGLVLTAALMYSLATRTRREIHCPPHAIASFRYLVVFYLISGFANSFIDSFPNNQLFFIALGAWLIKSQPHQTRTLQPQ